jgi:hypothetical protein
MLFCKKLGQTLKDLTLQNCWKYTFFRTEGVSVKPGVVSFWSVPIHLLLGIKGTGVLADSTSTIHMYRAQTCRVHVVVVFFISVVGVELVAGLVGWRKALWSMAAL